MSAKIIVPSVGESVTEGVISSWLKKDGDFVKVGESLFELETDKITTEVPAQESGIVRISVQAGSTVIIGAAVGSIEPGSGNGKPSATSPAAMPAAASKSAVTPAPAVKPAAPPNMAFPSAAQVLGRVSGTAAPAASSSPIAAPTLDASPSVRRKLMEGEKVAAPAKTAAPTPSVSSKGAPAAKRFEFEPGQREARKRLSPLRQRIAQRLVASQQETATLTTFNEVDMSAVMDLRERYKEPFKQKYGVSLGFMSFFVKAAIAALKTVPEVNARLEGGTEMVYQNFYDIGIAVSTDKGLVVPVLRGADKMNFAEIEQGITDLAVRAREGKLTIEELQGGTFTISNGGIYGSLMSTPILNPPQSGILGMHAIKKRPVVINDNIEIRPMMYLALSYDHRVIDGRESVTFLVNVKEFIETPGKFLLDLI